MKSSNYLVLAIAVLSAPLAPADETSSYEHLKGLEWLVGQWEGEFVLPDGVPELGSAGDKVHSKVGFRWMHDKNFLVFTGTDTVDGRVINSNRETTAWDSTSKKLVHTIFGANGFHGRGEWSGSGFNWNLKWTVQGPDSTRYAGNSTHKRIDENSYIWQMTGLTQNGKKIPDWPAVTYKRVRQQSPLSQAARRQLRYFVGKWNYSWEMEGERYEGTWNVRWSPDRTCLLSHWSNDGPQGKVQGTITLGWDELEGQLVDVTFASDGTYAIARYDIKNRRVHEGSRSGVGRDGKALEGKLRLEKQKDAFTWKLYDHVLGGETQPDLEFEFRRATGPR